MPTPDDAPSAEPRARRLPPRWPAAIAGLLLAVIAAAVLVFSRAGDDVDVNATFTGADVTESAGVQVIPEGHPADDGFRWPIFGGNPQRTQALKVEKQLHPPYKTVWVRRGSVLLEFTPVSCGRSLYLLRNDGVLIKLSRRTGVGIWKRKLGALAASSPACSDSRIYVSILRARQGHRGRQGRRRRRRVRPHASGRTTCATARSPRRCSVRDRLYLGTEDGNVLLPADQGRRPALADVHRGRGEGRRRDERRQAVRSATTADGSTRCAAPTARSGGSGGRWPAA